MNGRYQFANRIWRARRREKRPDLDLAIAPVGASRLLFELRRSIAYEHAVTDSSGVEVPDFSQHGCAVLLRAEGYLADRENVYAPGFSTRAWDPEYRKEESEWD